MKTLTIQRQYDEVIAAHYDLDPQSVIGPALDRAADQVCRQQLFESANKELFQKGVWNPKNQGSRHLFETAPKRLSVFDVGVGTGVFLEKLAALGGPGVQPFGLDLSEKMIDAARRKIPGLVAAVDDAVNLDAYFPDQSFDLICTHFITGFVPMRVLAPKIWSRLEEGGHWSFVGGTKAGFPALQAKANGKALRWLLGGRRLAVDEMVCNPAGREEVVETLEGNGFMVQECETFEPELRFRNLDEFMDFAYRGGWLTPFIEALGLHNAGASVRLMMNTFFFPVDDHHNIEIALAQKVAR